MHLDATLTVSQLLLSQPAALPLLKAAGIDPCCDGQLSLAGAAARAGISLRELVGHLQDGISQSPDGRAPKRCACDCGTS